MLKRTLTNLPKIESQKENFDLIPNEQSFNKWGVIIYCLMVLI